MDVKNWKVLSWNVSGINSDKKWNVIRDRVSESCCDVICLQETKRSHFDAMFIRQFCPPVFDQFEFLPSNGAFWWINNHLEELHFLGFPCLSK